MPRESSSAHPWPLNLFDATWRNDRPDEAPALPPDTWWPNQPWHQRVDGLPVDEAATARLHADEQIHVRGAQRIVGREWDGSPIQRVDSRGPLTRCWHRYSNQYIDLPLPRRPQFVRRFGDPTGHFHGTDSQWFGIDPVAGLYYEVGALGWRPGFLWIPGRWEYGGAYVHDLNAAPPPLSGRAITAANLPMFPLVPSVDDLLADRNRCAQHFCFAAVEGDQTREGSFANWSTDWIPPATDTDGQNPSHWAKAGMRLRFRGDYRPPAHATDLDLARVEWGKSHGFILTDQTSRGAGHLVRGPQDRRADFRVHFTVDDFEVVAT